MAGYAQASYTGMGTGNYAFKCYRKGGDMDTVFRGKSRRGRSLVLSVTIAVLPIFLLRTVINCIYYIWGSMSRANHNRPALRASGPVRTAGDLCI